MHRDLRPQAPHVNDRNFMNERLREVGLIPKIQKLKPNEQAANFNPGLISAGLAGVVGSLLAARRGSRIGKAILRPVSNTISHAGGIDSALSIKERHKM